MSTNVNNEGVALNSDVDNKKHLVFIVNMSSFFISHRLPIALEAKRQGYQVSIISGLKDTSGILKQHGLTEYYVPFSRSGRHPFKELRLCYRLYTLCKSLKPSLVHNVTIKPVIYGSLISRFVTKCPTVNAVPGLGYSFIQKGLKARLFKRFLLAVYRLALKGKSNITIFQNSDDRDFFISNDVINPQQTTLIKGSGICLNEYSYTSEPDISTINILLPARMLWDKGVGEFVDAAKRMASFKHAKFILCGGIDSNNPSAIDRKTIERWREVDNIEWLDFQDDMFTCYKGSHIVCLPSYREGMPKCLLEAQAVGRPVITTNVPGCKEAIIPGKTGLLVPLGDINALVKALTWMISHHDERQQMGHAARQFAERTFSINDVTSKTLEIYNSMIIK